MDENITDVNILANTLCGRLSIYDLPHAIFTSDKCLKPGFIKSNAWNKWLFLKAQSFI